MLTTIFAVMFIVAAFILVAVGVKMPKEHVYEDNFGRVSAQSNTARKFITISGIGSFIFGALIVVMGSVRILAPTDVAIPITFGSIGEPMGPGGVHVVAPWTDLESYPTRGYTVELSGDSRILSRTADAGQMQVEIATRWAVDPKKAKTLYTQTRTGDEAAISELIVAKNLRQAVGEVFSRTTNLTALNNRNSTTADISDQLQEQLDPYGIDVVDVNIRSVEPDEATATVIGKYAQQQQATRIAEEAKKTAEIEAQRRVIEAQGLKDAAKTSAGITADEADIICLQVWQQTVSKAIEAGVPVYTNPCGNGADVSVIAGSNSKN